MRAGAGAAELTWKSDGAARCALAAGKCRGVAREQPRAGLESKSALRKSPKGSFVYPVDAPGAGATTWR